MTPSISRKRFSLRTWATPVTIGSFLLMSVTGILMFFDIVPGFVTFAHEWFSWVFILGTVAHIAINFRPFRNHLRSNWGRASVAAFSLVVILSVFSWGHITLPQLKWPIANALVNAPLSALAEVKRTDTDGLLQKLEKHGIKARADKSIQELAQDNGADAFHLLGLVFLPEESSSAGAPLRGF